MSIFRLAALHYQPKNILRVRDQVCCLTPRSSDQFFPWQGTAPRSLHRQMSGVVTPPGEKLVGLGRFELPTSPLSGVRSNQLSYRPDIKSPKTTVYWSALNKIQAACEGTHANFEYLFGTLKGGDPAARSRTATLLRLHPSHKPHRGKRSPEG